MKGIRDCFQVYFVKYVYIIRAIDDFINCSNAMENGGRSSSSREIHNFHESLFFSFLFLLNVINLGLFFKVLKI